MVVRASGGGGKNMSGIMWTGRTVTREEDDEDIERIRSESE